MASRDGMFRREVRWMWGSHVLLLLLGFLAALFVPFFIRSGLVGLTDGPPARSTASDRPAPGLESPR